MSRISVVMAVVCAVTVTMVASGETFPYAGKVNASRVNVRCGVGQTYRILKVARQGDLVIALEKTGDWLKIECPEGAKGWVYSRFIRRGRIIGDNINVRATNSTQDVVLAQLNKGDDVEVVRTMGEWTEIKAPKTATAYIFAKYVTYVEGYERHLKNARTKETIEGLRNRIERDLAREGAKGSERWNLVPIIEDLKRLKAVAEAENLGSGSEVAIAFADAKLEYVANLKKLSDRVKEAEEELRRIAADTKAKRDALNTPLESYTAKGWVEDVGPRWFRPGTHRLRMGQEPLCYLSSDKYNLYDYVGALVGIQGKFSERRGAKILTVNKLDVLHAEKSDF